MTTYEAHCERDGDRSTLVFVRHLRHEPARVWAALTDPDQLAQWSPFTADRDLAELGHATLTMIDGDTNVDLAADVRRVEEPTLLEYTWGADLVVWQLEAVEGGTRLTLRHTVEDPDFVAKAAAGWHLCLDVAERLLDGDPVPPIRGDDALNHGWQELHDEYAAVLATGGR